ncbi:MAG: sulfurase [Planctomycetes bacterium]|nr:sulfurase [Planctomycetota bacterium]
MTAQQTDATAADSAALTEGRVERIFIVPQRHVAPELVASAHLVPRCGVRGHKNFVPEGHTDPGKELTLIAREALEYLLKEHGLDLQPHETRRNVLTAGIDLNQLVGREFTIGAVRAKGVRLCEPCCDLVSYTGKQVLPALVHRGGLRAGILTEGTIRPGDIVRAV